MVVRGSVDVVSATEVRGWAFSPGAGQPVRVQAVLNHEIVGEALADINRPDLAAAGLGDGNSGYAIKLFRPIDPIYLPFLSVKIDDGDAELPRAPQLGFRDFFTDLYRRHPAAGRSRSVFGGLWTDRTDAAALLRGKSAIGQIDAAVVPVISQLIHAGVAIVELAASPRESAWRDALAERIADLLEDAAVLPVLRAVLEDNPLVVRADWIGDAATPLAQPSTANPAPSPAECLALIVPFGDGVTLDVVRDSHRLPEFTPSGVSRWGNGEAAAGLELVAGHGLLDRHVLAAGSVAVVGPGAVYRVRGGMDGAAVRVACLPARQTPVNVSGHRELARATGAVVML
jgi:hypothetical protein